MSFIRSMRITYRSWSIGTIVALAPLALAAQQTHPARAQGRSVIANGKPLSGVCESLTSAPTELSRTPEGMALLRFKRELDGAATTVEQRGSGAEPNDLRRMLEMRRGVDSLMHVFVRYFNADGSPGTSVTVKRGDSTMIVDGKRIESRALIESMEKSIKAIRPEIEVTLRALEPQSVGGASSARMTSRATPTGYMGLNLSGAQIRMMTDSGSFTAHCDYPMVESVEVGSPARQAGIAAGDTVLAYNGRDIVAQTVNYPQLLVPGKVVKVRVRRDGKARDMAVTVSERPANMADNMVIRFVPAPGAMMVPSMPRTAAQGTLSPSTPGSGGGRGGVVLRGNMTGMPVPAMAGGATMFATLGATFNAIDEEFAQTMGVEQGVLVLRVLPGSPAADAGLRAGEMVRAVNGNPVKELSLIQRAIGMPGAHDVKLTVTGRETPARIVTIRW